MNQRTSFFQAASFFMVRTPLLPSETFYRLLQKEDLEPSLLSLYQSSHLIREAIAIASPDLYAALSKIDTLDQRERKQAFSSLLKYILRMSTRATPFGLFSAVGKGQFAHKGSAEFDLDQVYKYARPDMEWLFALLNELFREKKLFSLFSFQANPLLIVQPDRIILPYSRRKEGKQQEVSISASPLISQIVFLSQKPIKFDDLIEEVMKSRSDLERDKVSEVIFNLVQEDILYPDLFPSLLSDNLFQEILKGLKKLLPDHRITKILETVFASLEEYKGFIISKPKANLSTGETHFDLLEKSMRVEVKVKTCLQVDSGYQGEIVLPDCIVEELEHSVSMLWSLSKQEGLSYFRSYHKKFLEKYGTFRLVSLTELLHEVKGLGFPDYNEKPLENSHDFTQILAHAIWEKKKEIVLDPEFFKKYQHLESSYPFSSTLPSSFDLYCEISASSMNNIEKGEFEILLHPVTGAGDGCSTFGRFIPVLGENTKRDVQNFLHLEEQLSSPVIFVENSYFPSSARSANVAINPCIRKEKLDLGFSPNSGMSLQDIYVGATEKFFYLAAPHLGKPISVVALNALNPQLAPPVIRFLREISKDSCRFLLPFNWGNLSAFPYQPRVRYGKTIFSPATWQITLDSLRADKKIDTDLLIKKLTDWISLWSLPRYAMMSLADHRILLDLTHPSHLREIAHALKNKENQAVILIEKNIDCSWFKSSAGTHFAEIVIPFLRKPQEVKSLSISEMVQIPLASRLKLPGSSWLYLKLYLPMNKESSFLLEYVAQLIGAHYDLIDSWFFVRYQEEKRSVIRLRCKLRDIENLSKMLQAVNAWAFSLIERGLLNEILLGSYEREVERYGGIEAIEQAEDFFYADSEFALSILHYLNLHPTLSPELIVAVSILELLTYFGLSKKEAKEFFDLMSIDRKYLEGFRELKSDLLDEAFLIFEEKRSSLEGLVGKNVLEKLIKAVEIYRTALKPERFDRALRSVLHMHCNRILGINNELEYRSYLFANKALESMQSIKKEALVCTMP